VKKSTVYLNGKLIPEKEARIPIRDRGLLYGDGVFESLTTRGGKPFLLEEHIKRLLRGAKTLRIRAPLSPGQLKSAVLKTVAANGHKESYVKIILTRGEANGHGLDPARAKGKPTIIILAERQLPCPGKMFSSGWKAVVSSVVRPDVPTSRIKSLCYADNILAKIEAKKAGAQEAFLLDEAGNILEGTISNVFIVRDGTLYTPPLSSPILPGVTRKFVLKLARQSAFRIVEKPISPKELYTAEECFITFSGAGIVPITRIWNKKISSGKCGPVTEALIRRYGSST
jgi:branched-chain amino acid aminotransferase